VKLFVESNTQEIGKGQAKDKVRQLVRQKEQGKKTGKAKGKACLLPKAA